MFGYVRPVLEKMSQEDADRFQSAYCGLCYELDEKYGFWARWILNYDFTFLAILLSKGKINCSAYHCPCKGFRTKKRIASSEALSVAADESVILTYWKICDEIEDNGFVKSFPWKIIRFLFKGVYRKASASRRDFADTVEQNLRLLHQMEKDHIPSIDRPADAFAKILASAADGIGSFNEQRIHRELLYHLGRWIYLVDALDDLKKDTQEGKYNPLIYRFQTQNGQLDDDSRQRLIATIDHSVNSVSSAFELDECGEWTGVLQNIIYYGLPSAGRLVLEGKWNAKDGIKPCSKKEPMEQQSERTEHGI